MENVAFLPPQVAEAEEFDVVIIGAGIAGIGAGYRLAEDAANKSFVILEARDEIGGTWSLFRYPGIRSDSDMQTYGYSFRPWTRKNAIAPAHEILDYLEETAKAKNVDKHIRLNHRVISLDWSSDTGLWTVTVEKNVDKQRVIFIAKFVYCGTGYYDYDQGFTPEFLGSDDFSGTIIHPQHWPENFDYSDKNVVIIGSGATAVTLLPSLADKAKKVVQLQRSPTYLFSMPQQDKIANALFKILPEKIAGKIVHAKNTAFIVCNYQLARRVPGLFKKVIAWQNKRLLPKGYDMGHFTPKYNPWDQRVCVVPNADFFKAICAKKADVVTDAIERFDATGIALQSGKHIDADVIVTATGLLVSFLKGVTITVDGKPIVLSQEMSYLGAMLTNVPNLIFGIGYTNASWTLKMDLTYDLMLKVLKKLDESHASFLVIRQPDDSVKRVPFMDMEAGYLARARDLMPRAGTTAPWISRMNYYADKKDYKNNKLDGLEVELH